ncbi:MICOS complex subunit MIC27 isoform X2 [Cylas formicarius]|uniref:MICOS complex subunit MIC27 isoform X2 n=1 Tax=Cylas formicarius TaxID=197179 RepID=UPI002958C934|nr:MICOS complex subunit MIC27 isoform X2 [Cylas formicarius]
MFYSKVIGRALFSAAAVVVESDVKVEENKGLRCRPSELPIYTSDVPTKNQPDDQEPVLLENSILSAVKTIEKIADEIKAYQKVAVQSFNESRDSIDAVVEFLRQEDNTLPKVGAVGIGALTGLIFGLRGGFIKRTIYATTGALGIAAICYPKEASEYSQVGLTQGKKYITVAYNFVYGVKKDDPPLELPTLPKLPFEDWDSLKAKIKSFISEDSQKVIEKEGKGIESVNEK